MPRKLFAIAALIFATAAVTTRPAPAVPNDPPQVCGTCWLQYQDCKADCGCSTCIQTFSCDEVDPCMAICQCR
ncbi:MAG TPA: hypothetical protein VGX68_01080 [Thermoanaerobaculia bacterium]|nr:hypothetical protein [Thermoanaerobaculia bacterium]